MNSKIIFFFLFAQTLVLGAHAVELSDYTPYDYDVRFTNPVCESYNYSQEVLSQNGDVLKSKPKNAYCKSSDLANNLGRAGTPSEKILGWIRSPDTKEIFMTYLSFSSQPVALALCEAMKTRQLKVQIVLDHETDTARVDELEACGKDLFEYHLRGHVPGIDFAHNKLFIVNPRGPSKEIKISFGSGNMTSGLVLHHENWHFITTSRESYFAQAHLCLMDAEISHASSGKEFTTYMKSCLAQITAPPESDIQVFFVPGLGGAAFQAIEKALSWSENVKLASHRFSFNKLNEALLSRLSQKLNLKLVFDDDIFWINAPNTRHENTMVRNLEAQGAQVKFIETNHGQKLLQHNKFIVFGAPGRLETFVGAGNFTGTAFSSNWENFYYIKIRSVAEKMDAQFNHLYENLASDQQQLPQKDTSASL